MAVQAHPTNDDWGSVERSVIKWFKFASVADNDTFEIPMSHPIAAWFAPNGSTPITTSVEIDTGDYGSNTVTATFQLGATSGGTLFVLGSGV
jgi:hypothetical protein